MEPIESRRRSARVEAASDREEKERKDGAVSDNDAEDADEDSEGPGSYRGRAHVLPGVSPPTPFVKKIRPWPWASPCVRALGEPV